MDADEENGCLQVIPGSHRGEELLTHCPGGKKVLGSLHVPGERVRGRQGGTGAGEEG